jgi:hypothetical protein
MKGVISFLDILGYQSFLENNSATDSALDVLNILTTLPKKTHEEVAKFWSETNLPKIVSDNFQHVIFSDTILLTIPYGENFNEQQRNAAVAYMTVLSARLAAAMFQAGLPLRGVVHEGEFITKDTCFAGKGIVEAYRYCSRLDFSGVVCSPEIEKCLVDGQKAKSSHIKEESFSRLFVSFLSPLKDDAEERQLHINWALLADDSLKAELKADVIQCVLSHFWAHEKDCPTSVDGKIRNTCKVLRRLRIAEHPLPPKTLAT